MDFLQTCIPALNTSEELVCVSKSVGFSNHCFDIRQTGPDWEIKFHLIQQQLHVAIAFIEDMKSIRKAKNQTATLASVIIEDTIFYQLYLMYFEKL